MSIFVVDDHPLMREAVVMLVRRMNSKFTAVELDRLAAVGPAIQTHGQPELVCLDLKLPDTHGVSGVRELKQMLPEVPIVVISAASAQDYEDLALEAGAAAYIAKSAGASEISLALRTFLMDDEQEAGAPPEKLSKRQKQLLVMLDKGLSNRDIAEELQISEHTVKVHLWRLFRRLNVKSRSQASHLARTQGLV
jgi:DNA-binding NarL/FixJ family response regulator